MIRILLMICLLVAAAAGQSDSKRASRPSPGLSKTESVEFCGLVNNPKGLVGKQVKVDLTILVGTVDGLTDPIKNACVAGDKCEFALNVFEIESEHLKKHKVKKMRSELLCIDGADPCNCSLPQTFLISVEPGTDSSGKSNDRKPKIKIVGIVPFDSQNTLK
jgi:hypothetical protein